MWLLLERLAHVDCLSRMTQGLSLKDILDRMCLQTLDCCCHEQWELRRMSSQVLPLLADVMCLAHEEFLLEVLTVLCCIYTTLFLSFTVMDCSIFGSI